MTIDPFNPKRSTHELKKMQIPIVHRRRFSARRSSRWNRARYKNITPKNASSSPVAPAS